MPGFTKGKSGNPRGRDTLERERFKFDFLDEKAIPASIQHLYHVVIGDHEDIKNMRGQEKVRLQNEAAKALLAKAPERHDLRGKDGSELDQLVVYIPKKDEGMEA